MAKYTQLINVTDPALVMTEEFLVQADVFVDAELLRRGIALSSVILPQPLLSEIASAYAKALAALDGAIGENSPLIAKHKSFTALAEGLGKAISPEALGITRPAGSGYGVVTLGRG